MPVNSPLGTQRWCTWTGLPRAREEGKNELAITSRLPSAPFSPTAGPAALLAGWPARTLCLCLPPHLLCLGHSSPLVSLCCSRGRILCLLAVLPGWDSAHRPPREGAGTLKAADHDTPERVQLYFQRAPEMGGAWVRGLAPASPQGPGPQLGCGWWVALGVWIGLPRITVLFSQTKLVPDDVPLQVMSPFH